MKHALREIWILILIGKKISEQCKYYSSDEKGILALRSQGKPQSHTAQQTPCKRFIGRENPPWVRNSRGLSRRQVLYRVSWGGGLSRVAWDWRILWVTPINLKFLLIPGPPLRSALLFGSLPCWSIYNQTSSLRKHRYSLPSATICLEVWLCPRVSTIWWNKTHHVLYKGWI